MHSATALLAAIPRSLAHLSTTRANSVAGLATDALTGVALIGAGLCRDDAHLGGASTALGSGLLAFTFVEYAFHRWLFHGRTSLLERGHHKHHVNPLGYDSLPFFVSPLLMLVLLNVLALALPLTLALLVAGALAAGYAAYGLLHVTMHYRRFRHPLARRWAASHHVHHRHPECNFGVTTPLWDILLHTRYVSRRDAASAH